MIHYHGGPVTPNSVAVSTWTARHACVSWAYPDQAPIAFEVAQSVILDNGAFTLWKQGSATPDWSDYVAWVREWRTHPAFDWCLIPDVIDGTEADNDGLLRWWLGLDVALHGVPVWHLHESMERLEDLIADHPRVALGSSGPFAEVESPAWWGRMAAAMGVACDDQGRPRAKLHGLRMLSPTVFSSIPLSSADSTNVARNIGLDSRWTSGAYRPVTKEMRALILTERIERHAAAARWYPGSEQRNLELIG